MAFTWIRPQQEIDPEVEVFSPESDDAEDDTDRVIDGRYELRETIAWGGTAAVYKAFDRHTKIFVAVKVLCSGLREQIDAYFDQEGRVAAAISNPHLVRAHDRGVGEPPYIVFELVPGQALPQLYFGQPMPWRELCEVMLPVLDGLDALHQEGIVHRDVKPDNVIVQRRIGRESRVSLLDVGFAAVPPGRISNAPAPDEIVFGTAGYIAPEYFAGHLPDPRCDLFSVGALMYTMLTTRPVLDARELGDLLAIPPPRVIAPGAEIPESVQDIVMRALSDLGVRFQTAREMAAAIQAALAPPAVESIVAAPVERVVTVERVFTAKPSPRWSGAILALGVGLGVAGSAGIMSFWTGDLRVEVEGPVESGPVKSEPQAVVAKVDAAASTPSAADALSKARPAADAPSEARPAADAPGVPVPSVLAEPSGSRTPTLTSTSPSKRSPVQRPRAAAKAAGTFTGAMVAIEPKIRACAAQHDVPLEPTMVKVRGAGGMVESVRVLGMSSQHPFSQCVDRVVREAKPPLEGGLVEAFEFFRKA